MKDSAIMLPTVLLTACIITSAYGQLTNGSFADGLTGWSAEGSVHAVTSPSGARGAVLDEQLPAARSRIFQSFIVPDHPTRLIFWYKLATSPSTRAKKTGRESFVGLNGRSLQRG